jgi:LPXTG-motif cell wall-anchored protein
MRAFTVAFVVTALLLGLLAFVAPRVQAASVPITLHGDALMGWGNTSTSITSPGPTLTVHVGDSVTITLISEDDMPHKFLIDYNGDGGSDAGEPESDQFTSQITMPTFTADRAGTFTYLCEFHPGAMRGTIVVLPSDSPATPTGGDNTVLYLGIGVVVVAAGAAAVVFLRRRK